jgi:hypothetical protein
MAIFYLSKQSILHTPTQMKKIGPFKCKVRFLIEYMEILPLKVVVTIFNMMVQYQLAMYCNNFLEIDTFNFWILVSTLSKVKLTFYLLPQM